MPPATSLRADEKTIQGVGGLEAQILSQSLKIPNRPLATALLLILSDVAMLCLAAAITVRVRHYFGGDFRPPIYWELWPAIGLFIAGFAAVKLYPGAPLSAPEEIRRVFLITTIVYLALGTLTFFMRSGTDYSRLIFLSAWALSIPSILIARSVTRLVFAHRSWWGYPAVIFGAGITGRGVAKLLLRQPGIGLKPIAMLDDKPSHRKSFGSVPVPGGLSLGPELAKRHRSLYAIIALSDLPDHGLLDQLTKYERTFPHVVVIPDLTGISTLGVVAQDFGGMLGLEIRQRLLDPWRVWLKRSLELAMIVLFSPILLILFVTIAIAIKLTSRGPVLYGHERIGLGGMRFKAWKFRSMIKNADKSLGEDIHDQPKLQHEWQHRQKIKRDPRVTPIGRFLRRTSLDELPQIWNVLLGQMSLVGPRPIVEDEIPKYGEQFSLFTRVRPGMTGLWQVSGRNNLPYSERVRLDTYYVRNWSVWLDIHLLSRTIVPVLFGDGAY